MVQLSKNCHFLPKKKERTNTKQLRKHEAIATCCRLVFCLLLYFSPLTPLTVFTISFFTGPPGPPDTPARSGGGADDVLGRNSGMNLSTEDTSGSLEGDSGSPTTIVLSGHLDDPMRHLLGTDYGTTVVTVNQDVAKATTFFAGPVRHLQGAGNLTAVSQVLTAVKQDATEATTFLEAPVRHLQDC